MDLLRDGILFKSIFTAVELTHYISTVLDESAIAVAPGIVFVFKDREFGAAVRTITDKKCSTD